MGTEFTDVHLQDLLDVLGAVYTDEAIADAIRRFDDSPAVVEAAEERPLEGFRAAADTGRLPSVLAYLLGEEPFDDEQEAALRAALDGTHYSIRTGAEGLELHRRITGVAERSVESAREYLEQTAPSMVLTQLESAERNLAEGEYDLAAAELVRAFDALVVSDYTDGLEQLVERGLISVGTEHEYTDANMLYVVYGYCSMLGGDPEFKGFETSRRQAELGLVAGEQALYFLVQTLEAAVDEGEGLGQWEYP